MSGTYSRVSEERIPSKGAHLCEGQGQEKGHNKQDSIIFSKQLAHQLPKEVSRVMTGGTLQTLGTD